jgi:putative ABC transport system permease protein
MTSVSKPVTPDILEIALDRFRSHPSQTWLTLLGLVVGTASVIFMVTLGLTGRGFVQDQIEGVGSRLVWAYYEGSVSSGVLRSLDDQMQEGDVKAIAARGELFAGVTALVKLHGETSVLNQATEIAVFGTWPNYGEVRKNLRILKGRFLDEDDVDGAAKVCVVSRKLYEELWGSDPPEGKVLHTLGMSFAVVGEFEEPVDTLGQGDVRPRTIFIPMTVGWFFSPRRQVDILFAEVRESSAIPYAMETVKGILAERHHPGSQYQVESMVTVIRLASAISLGLMLIFVLVAAISVIVGGVGIMNIMLASVEQRIHEIGLRKSLGARKRDIRLQFLLEALLLGVAGSALGTLLGLAIPLTIRAFVAAVDVRVSGLSAVFAFLFSLAVTLLFGIAPAWRAASLDPVQALRHD